MEASPAVHGEDLAGHEGRVEEEIFYRAGHVGRIADPREGRLRDDARFLARVEVLPVVGPQDRARRGVASG